MNAVLVLVWVAFLLAPGYAMLRVLDPARALRRLETLALAFALGVGWVTLETVVLRWMSLLTFPWLACVTAVVVLASFARRRLAPRASAPKDIRPTMPFILLWATIFVAQVIVLLPLSQNVFGADSYTWAEIGTRLACAPGRCEGEGLWVPVLYVDPSGYGYLMASAASFGIDLAAGDTLVALSITWTAFAMLGAFVLANRVVGPEWGAIGAVWYVSSYWSLYYLMTSVARQGLGLGFPPLVFWFLATRGVGAVRDPVFYGVLGAAWLVHPFSVFIVLLVWPVVLLREWRAEGTAGIGVVGRCLALALALPPAIVLGRFVVSVLGLLSDAPYKYAMERFDPVVLASTLGPLNLLALASGFFVWRRRPRPLPDALWIASLTLFVILPLIGALPRDWYKASNIALPPHRYFLFYALVSLVWVVGLKLASARLRRASVVWLSLAALTLGQWGADAYFARRMLLPRARLQAALAAARWVDSRARASDVVAIHFAEPAVVQAVTRAVLAPRRIVEVDELTPASAARAGARYWISDVEIDGAREIEIGGSSFSVLELER